MSYLLCFGLGYSAQVLAHRLQLREQSIRIVGTTRPQTYQKIVRSQNGQQPMTSLLPFDRYHPLDPALFTDVSHVLISIPPDVIGDPVADIHGVDLIKSTPSWVGYLSTTGVYGDTQGAWVDETAPLRPSTRRSLMRVVAEHTWITLWTQYKLPVHIFRLSGIYGRNRSAVDAVRKGQAHRVVKPGHVSSRIHVEDLAMVLEASMKQHDPGSIYNVCDDEPASSQKVTAYAAELLGIPPPPAISWEQAQKILSPLALTFYVDNRRVRNDHMKYKLGLTLQYPTYREGLRQCL